MHKALYSAKIIKNIILFKSEDGYMCCHSALGIL